MCYSPADYADYADEYSMAALSRRERQVGIRVDWGLEVRLRKSAGYFLGGFLQIA